MKKFLLFAVAAIGAAFSTLAQTEEPKEIYKIDYSEEGATWSFFEMGYKPEVKDGALWSEQPGGWYQYFIGDQIPTEAGKNYKVTIKVKASVAGSCALNMGWGWGDGEVINSSVKLPEDWQEVSALFVGVGGESSNLVLQPGGHAGTIQIAWLKVEEVFDVKFITPEEGEVLASFYTKDGEKFGGWGDKVTFNMDAEEDGNPCLEIDVPAGLNPWDGGVSLNYDFEVGKTYYINVDIKSEKKNPVFVTSFNGKNGGCGSCTPLKLTNEWTNVTIFGTPFDSGSEADPSLPTSWGFNVGDLAGKTYIKNLLIYTEKESGVESAVAPVENGRTVVYNLLGVKVLDTDDASQVSSLKKGIYVVNGKKVAL